MTTGTCEENPELIAEYRQQIFGSYDAQGPVVMGPSASYTWRRDPRHLLFSMARYKFCAKMLAGKQRALEVGCGDAFCLPLILQTVHQVHGIDLEPGMIMHNQHACLHADRCSFAVHDMSRAPVAGDPFDAAFSLDVLEHIPVEREDDFLRNMSRSITPHGTVIIGTPNLTADAHASPMSRLGHINLKSHDTLFALMSRHFHSVLMFGMNDEVIHTGFAPMAHFLFAIGCDQRERT